jgi:L-2-hydroxycarboxylate dehydrogenase (NAD+)
MDTEFQTVQPQALHALVTGILQALGVREEDARTTADVLLAADLRGIDSHGVANLWRYVKGLQEGWINPRPTYRVLSETPALLRLDADAGLGQPAGVYAMRRAMEKAGQIGVGVAVVRNSNHYGIAGYYAMMALERQAMLGTNPIAVAAPAGEERPFVLDMATSVVPQGKIATYDRLGKPIPLGWALDEEGLPTTDTHRVLVNLAERAGGGLLPLGGEGELFGGHKGYGLALMVDILSAVLSGAAYADTIYPKGPDGKPLPANTGHFMMALDVRLFRPLEEFQAAMDDLIRRLKRSEKARGQTRIYIHGEKEFEMEEVRRREGIPLHRRVVEDLRAMAGALGVPTPF